jgi:hypothetical protein
MMQAIGPLRGTAARRATLGVLLLLLPWVLVAIASPSTAAAAEPPKAVTPAATGLLEIVTVPSLPGARFMVDGRIHRADRQGVIRLKVASGHKHKISVIDKKIAESDRTLQFVRWYYGNHDEDHLDALSGLTVKRNLRIKAGYRATYKLQYSFVDKARNPVDRTRVSRVEFRGDHGQTVSGNGSGRLTVVGIRPVVAGGTIIAKRVSYTVQRVDVDGSNVVQVNVQRFEPSRKTTVLIPLQLHTLHFSTRDFLFGNPVGQAVWLKYPDGHRFKVLLDADGKATVERLARGNYTVQVDAPGLTFERSLVLSRTQYVDLQHVSRPDIAVAAGAVAAFLFVLYLVRVRGRPVILRSARFGPSRIRATTQQISQVTMATQQSSTHEMADTEVAKPAAVAEEIPTQRISQVTMERQQLTTQEMADPGAADRGDVDAEKFDGEKELADEKLDGAVDYRTRVEDAQLPHGVRSAALGEVGKLERTSNESPESGEIRTWLDTILALPWSTNTSDSMDLQAEREVGPAAADSEKVDTEEVDPATADTKMVDGEQVDPALTGEIAWPMAPWAADTETVDGERVDPAAAKMETADTAPAGPHDDVTVVMPAVLAVQSGDRHHPRPQLPEQQVFGQVLAQNPREKRRLGSLVVAATALAALLVGTLLFGLSRDGGVTAQSVPTVTTATGSKPTSVPDKGGEESAIQLEDLPNSARPFQTVRIQGTYRGGADTFLRIQRWEAGKWLDFPLPTKTDRLGQFTTHVELGQPGRYQLRVLDPSSGVTSKTLVLVIKN